MTDAEKIADLERRVRELEAERQDRSAWENYERMKRALFPREAGGGQLPQIRPPDVYWLDDRMCDACRNGGVCQCVRPERGPTCAAA